MNGNKLKKINLQELKSRLSEKDTGCLLHYAECIDSTNEWAKREVSLSAKDEIHVYLADTQTAGKGRRGHSWESPLYTSVSMSILIHPDVPLENVSMLTPVMGMAAAEGMRAAVDDTHSLINDSQVDENIGYITSSGDANTQKSEKKLFDIKIKWPNDVVTGGRKLCGILTEMTPNTKSVIIGIGLNINMDSFPEELRDKATSLKLETGCVISREAVIAEVLAAFRKYYELFLQTGDFSGLSEQYESMLVNKNQKVRVLDPKSPFEGIAVGINERGELLVKRADTGEVEAVFAGEVSVRGIYGYV